MQICAKLALLRFTMQKIVQKIVQKIEQFFAYSPEL